MKHKNRTKLGFVWRLYTKHGWYAKLWCAWFLYSRASWVRDQEFDKLLDWVSLFVCIFLFSLDKCIFLHYICSSYLCARNGREWHAFNDETCFLYHSEMPDLHPCFWAIQWWITRWKPATRKQCLTSSWAAKEVGAFWRNVLCNRSASFWLEARVMWKASNMRFRIIYSWKRDILFFSKFLILAQNSEGIFV